jgi:hypothetical protein
MVECWSLDQTSERGTGLETYPFTGLPECRNRQKPRRLESMYTGNSVSHTFLEKIRMTETKLVAARRISVYDAT